LAREWSVPQQSWGANDLAVAEPQKFNHQHEKHELFVRKTSFIRDVGVVRGRFSFYFHSLA
jgi:hypothetical protein